MPRQLGLQSLALQTQIASTTVSYMGLLLTPRSKIIPTQRLQALTQTTRPWTKRELLSLLGLLYFFRIWVPNFALHAKPLYETTQGNLDEHLLNPTSLHTPYRLLSNIYYRLLLFTYLITPRLFSFSTFLMRTCLRDSVPEKGGHVGSRNLVI